MGLLDAILGGEDLERIKRDAPELLARLENNLDCQLDELRAIRTVLGYEYGLPLKGAQIFNPGDLQWIAQITVAAGKIQPVNVASQLRGKPASRGHISNIGANDTTIRFSKPHPGDENQETGDYLFKVDTTLDFDGLVWTVIIDTTVTSSDATVQFYAR